VLTCFAFRKTQARWDVEARDKLFTQKRGFLIQEFKLGIWTRAQYVSKIQELEIEMSPEATIPPAKRPRVEREPSPDRRSPSPPASSRAASPDWDLTNFYDN
jgi:hypothetical protein